MKILIDKLDNMDVASKQKLLTFALSNFDDTEFYFKGSNINDTIFSDKEKKNLLDTAISKLMESTEVDFLTEKIKLKDGESKLYHALTYSVKSGDLNLDDTTTEVADINAKFIDYIKVRNEVDDDQKNLMKYSYDRLIKSLDNKDYEISDKDRLLEKKMVDYKIVVNNNIVNNNSGKKSGMVRQIFFSLTLAAVVKKVFNMKGYGN